MHTIAQGTLSAPSALNNLWATQRAKILAVALILAFAVVLYVFFGLDYFYVFNFNIVGAQYLTTAEIEKASVVVGYNIFFIVKVCEPKIAMSHRPAVYHLGIDYIGSITGANLTECNVVHTSKRSKYYFLRKIHKLRINPYFIKVSLLLYTPKL